MYFVLYLDCDARVEIPSDTVGPDRTDLYNVVECSECYLAFDYEDDDVQHAPDESGRLESPGFSEGS